MSCRNCNCDDCNESRNRDLEFGLAFPCEYCGALGMSKVTTVGKLTHNCEGKRADRLARFGETCTCLHGSKEHDAEGCRGDCGDCLCGEFHPVAEQPATS